MRRFFLALALLPVFLVFYCSLPLTSVALVTVTLTDQEGRKIGSGASATFLDSAGRPVAIVTSEDRQSWDNNLHWWVHSRRSTEHGMEDVQRTVEVEVTAPGCTPARLPVALERVYEPLSFAPHGGGPAYFIYRYERKVALNCG